MRFLTSNGAKTSKYLWKGNCYELLNTLNCSDINHVYMYDYICIYQDALALLDPTSFWLNPKRRADHVSFSPNNTWCGTSSTSYQKTYFRHSKQMCNISATPTQECHHVVLSRKLMSLSTSLWISIQEQHRTTTCFFLQRALRNYDTHGKLTSMAATPDAHTLMKPSKKIHGIHLYYQK